MDVGIGDLFEDGLGFGSKTARSVRDVLLKPRRYFLAAQTKDWSDYTPSIRVYVVLLALASYFRYLYIGEGQVMTELYVGMFEQMIAELGEEQPRWLEADPRALTDAVLDRLLFYTPFVSFALYTLFGLAWRAYAEPLSAAVRIRYIYALLIPAQILLLLSTFPMVFLPDAYVSWASTGGLLLSAAAVSITAYLGAFPETESAGGRFGRALTLGVALIIVMLVATTISLLSGMFMSFAEVAQSLPPKVDS
ncbi:MAG: hypothetical protein WBG08_00795 [Litorimonas sp.]